MTPEETMAGWARKVVADGQWLLHTATLVVGPATEFFDGIESVYVSEANGEPVPGPVLKLATGHALVANPNAFVEIEPKEVEFYRLATEKLADFMRGAVSVAGGKAIPSRTTVVLLTSLLRAQLVALEMATPGLAPEGVMS